MRRAKAVVAVICSAHALEPQLFYESTPAFRDNQPTQVDPYEPRAHDAKTKFVIISSARSASSTLQLTISGHPHVSALSEAFHPHFVPPPTTRDGWSVERREHNRTAYMDYLFHRTDKHAEGFKFFSFHLKSDEYRCLAESPYIRKIVLEREDHYGQYLSSRKALITKCYGKDCSHENITEEELTKKESAYPFDDYKYWLEAWYDLQRDYVKHHPETWLFVTSESLFTDPDVMTKVYAHLHVDPEKGPMLTYNPYDQVSESTYDLEEVFHLRY